MATSPFLAHAARFARDRIPALRLPADTAQSEPVWGSCGTRSRALTDRYVRRGRSARIAVLASLADRRRCVWNVLLSSRDSMSAVQNFRLSMLQRCCRKPGCDGVLPEVGMSAEPPKMPTWREPRLGSRIAFYRCTGGPGLSSRLPGGCGLLGHRLPIGSVVVVRGLVYRVASAEVMCSDPIIAAAALKEAGVPSPTARAIWGASNPSSAAS